MGHVTDPKPDPLFFLDSSSLGSPSLPLLCFSSFSQLIHLSSSTSASALPPQFFHFSSSISALPPQLFQLSSSTSALPPQFFHLSSSISALLLSVNFSLIFRLFSFTSFFPSRYFLLSSSFFLNSPQFFLSRSSSTMFFVRSSYPPRSLPNRPLPHLKPWVLSLQLLLHLPCNSTSYSSPPPGPWTVAGAGHIGMALTWYTVPSLRDLTVAGVGHMEWCWHGRLSHKYGTGQMG